MNAKLIKKLAHSIADLDGFSITSIVNELKRYYNPEEICQEIINITNVIEIDVFSANMLLNILNNSLPQLSEYCTNLTVNRLINNGFVLGADFSINTDNELLLSPIVFQWMSNN